MNNLRISNPSGFSALVAALMSAFAFVFMTTGFGILTERGQSALLRTFYIAATYLLMFDVVECAYIAQGNAQNKRGPHFWIYAFYMGYFWMLLMLLMNWDGIESAKRLLLTWGIAGAFFGGVISQLGTPDRLALEDRYDLEKPLTERPLGTLYYIWPVLIFIIFLGFLIFPPTQGWPEKYFLFQLVFLGSVMQLYTYKKELFWKNFWPRGVGLGLLLYGLVAL